MVEMTPLSGAPQLSKLWKGVFAVAGIMTTLVTYDVLQEKIMRVLYDDEKVFQVLAFPRLLQPHHDVGVLQPHHDVDGLRQSFVGQKGDSGFCCSSLGFGFERDRKRWGMGVGWGRLEGRMEEGF
ncbi:hypothetical protein C1H46_006489 [Malus baccata]|uniref:Uncharacterized protein n=1 Tax=Malus baccata TaxID=106549 RepID=A0A540NA86_MALBA|nr:hypothetical protein C1H46_006489 [Malus baccata]